MTGFFIVDKISIGGAMFMMQYWWCNTFCHPFLNFMTS